MGMFTSINIAATSIVEGVTITGTGTINITGDKQIIPITVTALNGSLKSGIYVVLVGNECFKVIVK